MTWFGATVLARAASGDVGGDCENFKEPSREIVDPVEAHFAEGTKTILPTCSPRSIRSWAWGASAKVNTRSIIGRKFTRFDRRGQTCRRRSSAITPFSAGDLGRMFEARIVPRFLMREEIEKALSSPPWMAS